MALTDALRNGSHPITVHLMTCFGQRDALTARWHADVDALAPVGEVLDADLAAHLGDAFELCGLVDFAGIPPHAGFFNALDPGIAAGFLGRAGFEPAAAQETDPVRVPAAQVIRWRKKPNQALLTSEETDQFLAQAWNLVSLLDSYRHQVWDLDEDSLRRYLTTLHSGGYLRPLWEAYLERGRRQLQSLGTMAAAEPEFSPGWARGDLILGSTLIDIKTGWYVTDQLDYCLNQLLGYVLLDRSGKYAIDQIGIYLARYAATITWPLSTLLPELSGQPSVDLGQIRKDFAEVCQPSIAEHLAWLQAKQPASHANHEPGIASAQGSNRPEVVCGTHPGPAACSIGGMTECWKRPRPGLPRLCQRG
jgi:hypothetical protein